jgi:hypothetical protein
MCCTPTRQTRLNPETQIAFELPQDSAVRLEIYDVLDQRVRTLVAGQLSAGSHRVLWPPCQREFHPRQRQPGDQKRREARP